MPNIGIVLSGCSGKGGYEIGVMRAIIERFGIENIKCVSSASMGALIAQSYSLDAEEELITAFKEMDAGKYGKNVLGFATNKDALATIKRVVTAEKKMLFQHYVTIWNLTKSRVEYLPFHKMTPQQRFAYIQGAISVPVITKGIKIKRNHYYDGAFLDNIPVSPLIGKDLDYIFCVYFDNCRYAFESKSFDKKVIKIYDFPNHGRLELLRYKIGSFEKMYNYGYKYTKKLLEKLFVSEDPRVVYRMNKQFEEKYEATFKPRLTSDIVLNNINTMTKHYFRTDTKRAKRKD